MNRDGDWQEKYLNLLDQRDDLQNQFEHKQELLRRALVRVSLAAEGQNSQLDEDLTYLRAALKNDGDLAEALGRVETSLLQQERIKSQKTEPTWAEKLSELISRLQQQADNPATKKQLKTLVAECNKQPSPDLSALLSTLLPLQQAVFDESRSASVDGPGILGRIFGRSEARIETQPVSVNADPERLRSLPDEEPVASVLLAPESLLQEAAGDPEKSNSKSSVGKPAEFVSREDFLKISSRLQLIINDFIDAVELTENIAERAGKIRNRLDQGLSWFELAPTLEDIRDLALEVYCHVNDKNHQYLQYLYDDIADLLTLAGGTVKGYMLERQANSELESRLQVQLRSLGETVESVSEIGQLKLEIENHIQALRLAVIERQQAVQGRDMAAELEQLENRLRQAEDHAKTVKQELEQQRQQAVTDSLTSLPNREAYNQRATFEWQRMKRYGHPLILAVVDIDRFKQVNDKFGHQAGDRVLKVFSKTISQRLRSVDFIARYGGEEFVILLPETSLDVAVKLLNMIRQAIANAPFRFKEEPLKVTLSMGITQVREKETVEDAFRRADALLYQAKENGRDRCEAD